MKKNRSRKSRDTVPLNETTSIIIYLPTTAAQDKRNKHCGFSSGFLLKTVMICPKNENANMSIIRGGHKEMSSILADQ